MLHDRMQEIVDHMRQELGSEWLRIFEKHQEAAARNIHAIWRAHIAHELMQMGLEFVRSDVSVEQARSLLESKLASLGQPLSQSAPGLEPGYPFIFASQLPGFQPSW